MNLVTDLPEILKTRTLEDLKGDIVYVSYLQFNNKGSFFSKPSVNYRARMFTIDEVIQDKEGNFCIYFSGSKYGILTKYDKECYITNEKQEAIAMYNEQVYRHLNKFEVLVNERKNELLKLIK